MLQQHQELPPQRQEPGGVARIIRVCLKYAELGRLFRERQRRFARKTHRISVRGHLCAKTHLRVGGALLGAEFAFRGDHMKHIHFVCQFVRTH